MPNGLFTPGLVLEVAEATEDTIITQEEFSSIMVVITSVFVGAVAMSFVAILIKGVTKELERSK